MAKKTTKKAKKKAVKKKPAARAAAKPVMERRDDFGKPVSVYFDTLDAVQKSIAQATHRLLLKHAPMLTHEVKWGIAQYLYPGGRMMDAEGFAIYATSKSVNLAIGRGGELAKQHPLLEGTGKSMRHVKLKTLADVKSPAVEVIVRDAIALAKNG